ncbi:MAG: gliding motility-associated C-terminal domain-containing protein, partial [Bacteroidetes bacterium]|nr:gliding motility-associated C-terminal domain-containing protein [Bacteroidota bacterium]
EGASWNVLVNQNATYAYSNLTLTTSFRGKIKNGSCNNEYSSLAVVTVLPIPVGGTTAGTNTVCKGANSGSVVLTGNVGQIKNWEYSEDGINWLLLPGTSNSLNYLDLTLETTFRANVESCGQYDYSSETTIYIDEPSMGGEANGGGIFCDEANAIQISLINHQGDIIDWEVSTASLPNWVSLSAQTTQINIPVINETSQYRAVVKHGVCPPVNSVPETVSIDQLTFAGVITGDLQACKNIGQGNLQLIQNNGTIINWEKSLDGINWGGLNETASTIAYQNLPYETYFRAEVKNGSCPAEYSAPALVELIPKSDAGDISGDAMVCAANNLGAVILQGNTGDILWQWSTDKNSWASITSNTGNLLDYEDLSLPTYYRALITNQTCPADTSEIVSIKMFPSNITVIKNTELNIVKGESVSLPSGQGQHYLWSPAIGLSNPTDASPLASPMESTTYTLKIKDEYGCTDTATVKVIVSDEYELRISNLITPNGDGYNDTWDISPNYLQPFVMVLRLNGKTVYESANYDNNWDGTFNGKNLSDGTYYYLVKLDGRAYKGTLNILKGN